MDYTPKQELANSITHGFGFVLSMVGAPLLLAEAIHNGYSAGTVAALAVYSISLLLVYLSSTLYHALTGEIVKRTFKVIDHICIFFLIAGTTTALVMRYADTYTAKYFLLAQWSAVVLGVVYKLFYTGKQRGLSTIIYILLGAMGFYLGNTLLGNMPTDGVTLLFVGCGSYLLGTVFYLWRKLYYQHAIWHVFVLGGSVCHYLAVLMCYGS